jgi:8-oxo-dGTP pyrophosphatase MutT (NUDIX family)
MLLIYPKDEQLHTVLIQRASSNQNDKHSGQVSFPGGKLEKNDESMAFCAKRETFEEIGVPIKDIELLGALTPTYIPVSDFHVFPFVGFVSQEPQWKKQQSEVVEILQVPLFHFLEEKNQSETTIVVQGFTLNNVPYFDVFGKKVWGATAMILSEMNHVLMAIKEGD